jgi:TonB family protein
VSVSLFPWLTKGELAIVSAARGDRQAATLQQTMRQGREGLRERVSRLNRLRTLESLSPGFIADLVSVTGCKPMGGGWFAAAELAYQADGRPRAAMVMDENLSRACQAAIRAGVALTVPADGRAVSTEARDIVVLLFDPQLIACAAQPAGPRPPQTPAGGKGVSTLARPTWREPFTYPRAAQKSGVSGAVLVDVTMNHNGCVTSARTRRGLGPIIDLAVVQSAARWKFTPPTFNATPVAGGFTIVYDVEPPQWR